MSGIAVRNSALAAVMAVALSGCCGMGPECAGPPGYAAPPPAVPPPAAAGYPNPIFIPIADPQCAWEQVADVVDDYFRIEHEEPARIMGSEATTGTLISVAEVSPTIFEPWRHDTGDHDQRVENTLQTMRRRAVVHVTPVPAQGGCQVDVTVLKELENHNPPDHATAGAATFRYDSSLSRIVNPMLVPQTAAGWIPRGRDALLEQAIIGDLMSRCGQPCRPVAVPAQNVAPAR